MDAKLNLSRREQLGNKAKTLVNDGKVLGNIYAKGEESVAVYGDLGIVTKIVNTAGKNHPIEVTLDDGKEILVLVSEVERDNLTRRMHHVVFQTIRKGEKVTTEVPINQIGESPAVKAGLILITLMDNVEIEAIPSKIPEELTVSVEGLEEDGDSVTLADIVMPEGAEMMMDEEEMQQPIVKVETPRAQVEEEPEEEEIDPSEVPSEHGGDDGEDGGEGGDSSEDSKESN